MLSQVSAMLSPIAGRPCPDPVTEQLMQVKHHTRQVSIGGGDGPARVGRTPAADGWPAATTLARPFAPIAPRFSADERREGLRLQRPISAH